MAVPCQRPSYWTIDRWRQPHRIRVNAMSLRLPSVPSIAIPIAAVAISGTANLTRGTTTSTIVEYQIPRAGNFPHDPAVGPDGIVWYTDQTNSFIGRLDPATGEITDYPTPTPGS